MKSPHRFLAVAVAVLTTVVALGVLATAQSAVYKSLPGPDSSNFRPIEQINKSNVAQLEVAWHYPYAAPIFSPVFARDVLYGFGRDGALIALDAATGKEIWIHEGLNGINGKGINYWESEDGSDRRLIFSVWSFLQAIDARTGKSIPTFGVDGIVDLRKGLLRAEGTGLSVQPASPGRIWKNTIVFGGQAGEAITTPPGDIRAYDVVTGKLLWQFNTIPQPGQFGYDTNPADGWKYIGGANNWGEMALDEARGIVYIPTGSATSDYWGGDRHGQNLFANSLLALDARTGRRLWHFQTIHHDLWDLDNTSAPQLVTVTHDGKKVDVVAHAGKTGFLYVFNRVTGEPLWPIEERPVGRSTVPYELSWPTQPFPTRPPAFVRQSFGVDDVNPHLLTPEEYESMRDRVLMANKKPGPQGGLFVPTILDGEAVSMPGNQGGSNWGTTAADPERGLVFVTGVNQLAMLRINDVKDPDAGRGRGGNRAAAGELNAGQRAYQQYCVSCHLPTQYGQPGVVPPLVGITDRMDIEGFRTVVQEGRNAMRPILDATNEEIAAIYTWLEQTNPTRSSSSIARREGVGSFPPGPVVASGGAPRPVLPPRYDGPFYPGAGGTAGNFPWPEDVAAHGLPTRFQTGHNIMASSTKPPYTTITAYDLNTGEIKWQVPNGDDPQTVEMTTEVPGQPCRAAGGCVPGGVRNTGGVGARYGMVVTKSGLLFQLSKDGFARAYDVDTGEVLWKGPVAGGRSGIPVLYESKGRAYVLFMSPASGGGDPTGPSGYIAFALPQR